MMRSDRVVRQYLRTRFLITTKAGLTFDGVLLQADTHTFRLIDTESIAADGTRTTAAGEVFLPRADVAYMQKT